ncbi:hypothetical protein JR053_03430 [Wolbachia endosymbiont of Nasonia vitripennis]|uniref:hypothetical protein n=1 Tax=Wolbachia endosymbiont of Nasonia vitripennis TaxID=180837 RepID=UPI003A886E12
MAIRKRELLSWFRESVLNDHNLDLFKNFLQEKYKHAYKEWKEKEFDLEILIT